MLAIAHRMPGTSAQCQALSDAGATVFEVDIQVSGPDILISHAVPLYHRYPPLRHDGWTFSWSRVLPGEPLAAAQDRLPDGASLLLDLKTDRGAGALRMVQRLLDEKIDPQKCYVSSKNWAALDLLAEAGFRTWRSVAERAALRRLLQGPEQISSHAITVRHTFLTELSMPELQRFGRVIAWTVNDPTRTSELIDLGVAGITSDNPEVLRLLTRYSG